MTDFEFSKTWEILDFLGLGFKADRKYAHVIDRGKASEINQNGPRHKQRNQILVVGARAAKAGSLRLMFYEAAAGPDMMSLAAAEAEEICPPKLLSLSPSLCCNLAISDGRLSGAAEAKPALALLLPAPTSLRL